MLLSSSNSSTTINVEKIGQLIQGLIQRRFSPSCVYWVYFLRKYTGFHDMRTEWQNIKTSYSLSLYSLFLINLHQLLDFQRSIDFWLPNLSPMLSVLLNLFLASEAADLNPPSKIAFPNPVTSSVNEPAHWRSIRMILKPQPTKPSASSTESR